MSWYTGGFTFWETGLMKPAARLRVQIAQAAPT